MLLDPSQTKMVSYSPLRVTQFAGGENILKFFQTQSLYYNRTHINVYLRDENTITAPEVFKIVKTLKTGKAAG